jgi:hypothetical protein
VLENLDCTGPQLPTNIIDIDTIDDESELHGRVTEMYLEAARMSPHDPDPDVQIALGLLFNISQVLCSPLSLPLWLNDLPF